MDDAHGKPRGRQTPSPGELSDPDVSREKFLTLSRQYLSLLKKSLNDLRAHKTGGRAFVRSYSDMVDAIVGVLFQRALEEQGVTEPPVAVIAVGGYGRAELAPYSDVDIVVLSRRKTTIVKSVASSFIRLMWDVGFELGHAVHSLVESEAALGRHMDTRTALFESRWLCGSRAIAVEAEKRIERLKQRDREAFLTRKIRDAMSRHEKFGRSYQLVEPNVKLSPGGMRDFQTLVWLGMLHDSRRGLGALRKSKLLRAGEAEALESAYDFLLRTRVELHLATESKQDQLTVAMQKRIAERLGYYARGGHLAVEVFMRDYYNHTRTVYRITEDIIDTLQGGRDLSILLGGRRKKKDSGKLAVRLSAQRIRRDPLYVFVRQKESGLKLDRSLKMRLRDMLASELAGRNERSLMRRAFAELFHDGRNLTLVLRSMHETGFLGVIIPEYNDLTSLKRYDLYHHYTVDEHSLQVVQNLQDLSTTGSGRIDPLSRLYSEVPDKQVLFLAALLHDIGKIEGRGHARKGAVLSRRILRRLNIGEEVTKAVSFLIEIHLLMSHYSQRRDPTDLDTLESFCSTVRSRTNLKYLCLLTYADLKATSPQVWTDWKRSLLWALYLKAYEYLAKTAKKPETVYKSRKATLLRAFPPGERERALAHLDLLPGRYLLTMRSAQVKRHMALLDELDDKTAVVDKRSGRATTEVTFCTMDKPFRLSQLCGVLTLNDCNILFANAFTRRDGKVIDVFRVEDLSGTSTIGPDRMAKIEHDLDLILKGKRDVQTAVDDHAKKWKRRKVTSIPVEFKVEFENDLSVDVTIIDIFAQDRPGLLFKITRALSEEGLTIHRASISTEANRAIDSFDVQDKKGRKITSVRKLRQIRQRLEQALA